MLSVKTAPFTRSQALFDRSEEDPGNPYKLGPGSTRSREAVSPSSHSQA
ncbi:MAG TPA: hypothetical protein VLA84_13130 [Microcoleus sp.]|nr:hypothetical protein [Microcoleus sp.]